jgi:hypothetical protein
MRAYKFYLRDAIEGFELVGILIERRKKRERITWESIMHWGEKYFGKNAKDEDICFVETSFEERREENFNSSHNFNYPKRIN